MTNLPLKQSAESTTLPATGPRMPAHVTPVRIVARSHVSARAGETGVRYAAAYSCTLLSILAAQPRIDIIFAICLYILTALGVMLSLTLRRHGLRWRGRSFSRRFINGIIFLSAAFSSLLFLRLKLPVITPGENFNHYLIRLDARAIEMLMGVFLIFAVCRCLFILTDKDALLCTVPSFSVLLLLSVVHSEVSVLIFFVLWAIATSVLLALDHRSESRLSLSGYVPSVVPGQDIVVSARSLGVIIALSLACSLFLSYRIANRQGTDRGDAENWLYSMVSRLNALGLDRADTSVNAGPERTIDYTSGPPLPTRTKLWRVQAVDLDSGRYLYSSYWRLFTLTRYDGKMWLQGSDDSRGSERLPAKWRVAPQEISWHDWQISGQGNTMTRLLRPSSTLPSYDLLAQVDGTFTIARAHGPSTRRVEQNVRALLPTNGFIPSLPVVHRVQLNQAERNFLTASADGTIDSGMMQSDQFASLFSRTPVMKNDGTPAGLPLRRGERPNPGARLSASEQAAYLQLPRSLPPRVRNLAQRLARRQTNDEGDIKRARRIATFVERNAAYTLRPPQTPAGRDAVDYFLFSSRRGYCTYFAGALTVMCRAANIPARIVSGFANPEWETVSGETWGIIREANAHAWTEIWIDGWGWTALDATPSDDRGDNAPSLMENISDALRESLASASRWLFKNALMLQFALLFFLLAAQAITRRGALTWGIRGWKHGASESRPSFGDDEIRSEVVECYGRVARQLTCRFRRRASWETPEEWVQAAATTLALENPQPLQTLTQLYTRALYSTQQLNDAVADNAKQSLREISWQKNEAARQAASPLTRLKKFIGALSLRKPKMHFLVRAKIFFGNHWQERKTQEWTFVHWIIFCISLALTNAIIFGWLQWMFPE